MHIEHLRDVAPDLIAEERLRHVAVEPAWETCDGPEAKLHRIHPYPAKFPAFIAGKAFEYARQCGVRLRRVGDVFCGCGTVPYEARREGLEFWGCDINPVATLIARTKSTSLDPLRFRALARTVVERFPHANSVEPRSATAEARLAYWYRSPQRADMGRLVRCIDDVARTHPKYRQALLCAVSAIARATSQWRTRAIKPAFDPSKVPASVAGAFAAQCDNMAAAYAEGGRLRGPEPQIVTGNVLTTPSPATPLDLLVTSQPYVTSYEYADLHQLSALWLGFADDYRDLRRGAIGSAFAELDFNRAYPELNAVAYQVVFSLYLRDPALARAAAAYYLDIQRLAKRCKEWVRPGGIAIFLIGNTQYGDVHVDNASHLAEALVAAGFKRLRACRRRLTNKTHTPFRDRLGRLTRDVHAARKTYADEYILIAHR